MLNTKNINSTNRILLVVFLAIQPCIELMLSTFGDTRFSVLGISVFTLIRYLLLGAIIALALFCNIKMCCTKIFIGFLVASLIFIVLHAINVGNIDITVNNNPINKGFIDCAIFVSKYFLPVCVLFLVYILRFGYKELKICTLAVVCFIAAIMIISNIFRVDYIAYAFGSSKHPDGSILNWFTGKITAQNWRNFTSRGLFHSGNEISSLLSLLLPASLFIALKEKRIPFFLVVLVHLICLLMLGTRVAVASAVFSPFCAIVFWGICLVLRKTKPKAKHVCCVCAIAVVFAVFFAVSPFVGRILNGDGFIQPSAPASSSSDVATSSSTTDSDVVTSSSQNDTVTSSSPSPSSTPSGDTPPAPQAPSFPQNDQISFEEKLYNLYITAQTDHNIPWSVLINVYNYEIHYEFWFDLIENVPFKNRDTTREVKTLVLSDIKQRNNCVLDTFVGMGETSYSETDFFAQYYYLGIIGSALFVFPYALVLVISLLFLMKKLILRKYKFLLATLSFSLGFILVIALIAGHVLHSTLVPFYIALICGVMLNLILLDKGDIRNA